MGHWLLCFSCLLPFGDVGYFKTCWQSRFSCETSQFFNTDNGEVWQDKYCSVTWRELRNKLFGVFMKLRVKKNKHVLPCPQQQTGARSSFCTGNFLGRTCTPATLPCNNASVRNRLGFPNRVLSFSTKQSGVNTSYAGGCLGMPAATS